MTKLMKDVFELPLKSVDYQNQIQDANGVEIPFIDFHEYEKKAICEAVNTYDTLTEQNKQLVESLENISEYVDCIPLHFDSGMSQHSKMHIQHFVSQIKAHAVRGLAKHKEQI